MTVIRCGSHNSVKECFQQAKKDGSNEFTESKSKSCEICPVLQSKSMEVIERVRSLTNNVQKQLHLEDN